MGNVRERRLTARRQTSEAPATATSFNNIMNMKTFSPLDNQQRYSLRDDLYIHKMHKNRLLGVDLSTRAWTDPVQRWLNKYLRAFRYRRLSKISHSDSEGLTSIAEAHRWSQQLIILIAEIIGRVTTATFN
ncbi:hypothetical protein HBI24_165790 [Parastagonospora nodorum]|nr:hypothetical protein HBH43_094310 [Parastagonospora nodorum]KAH4257615.1 hypothetical protein HBI03_152870 [Parastagonospora nodorum]KAH4272985.1 hypothetical protein HBI04_141650 [Parastagonospora nodorum]KAH4295730.1 hypothetical protein HBI01_154380 [Parastagonospora nodorum]KAH4298065.1 hypothetical protein HBI02_158580 [Parastagonospora nodorum]